MSASLWVFVLRGSIPEFSSQLRAFLDEWTSHDKQVSADFSLSHDRVVTVFGADVSGCGIDKLFSFMEKFGVMEPGEVAYITDQVHIVSQQEFSARYNAGVINDETLVVDTSLHEIYKKEGVILPLGQSWHKRLIKG